MKSNITIRLTMKKIVCWLLGLTVFNWLVMWSVLRLTNDDASARRIVELQVNKTQPALYGAFQQIQCLSSIQKDFFLKDHPTKQNGSLSKCFHDKGEQYKIRTFSVYPTVYNNTKQVVCLSTQTSVDGLFWVMEQMKTWSGMMSIAVFVPDVDFVVATKVIDAMRRCNGKVSSNVVFHFVYPVDMPPTPPGENIDVECQCDDIESCNNKLVETMRSETLKGKIKLLKYPQNLMRNVGRDFCQSDYVFSPDVDMIGTPKMHENLVSFLSAKFAKECQKCAYIVPTYEIKQGKPNPINKTKLILYINKKLARRFHDKVFSLNQFNSNLSIWENGKSEDGLTHFSVLYNITSYKEFWEPVYITRSSAIKFDERFVGYGFTRNSQILEMEVAGYSWHMLDSAFLSHRGFQTAKGRSIFRKRQISSNSRIYKVFKKEILLRYGVDRNDRRFAPPPKPDASSKDIK